MAITPQAIKDQEFQTKFRGYDTIEVKGYLELIAEEFFELLEKIHQLEGEIGALSSEKELLEEMNKKLETDIETALQTTDDVREKSTEKDVARSELEKEIEELQTAQADHEAELKEWEDEVVAAEGAPLVAAAPAWLSVAGWSSDRWSGCRPPGCHSRSTGGSG